MIRTKVAYSKVLWSFKLKKGMTNEKACDNYFSRCLYFAKGINDQYYSQ